MLNYLSLTPAFRRWNKGGRVEDSGKWASYQVYSTRVDQMLCYIDLLWPEFIETDDLILRKGAIPEDWARFIEAARTANWSLSDIEYVVNHLHLSDVFLNDPDRDSIDMTVYTFLAQTISDTWKSRLNTLFPKREFVVEVNQEDGIPEVFAYAVRKQVGY